MSPLVAVCLSIGMLREQLLPIIVRSESLQHLLLFSGVIGLLYFAVLLFGELRLKRISAYVYLTHASVTAIVLSFASGSALPLEMQEANFLLGTSGLWITASLLASRLGVEGVRSANGLNSLFPGVGVCYLAATLSLVGFPGTLGFFSEELLLGELSHNIPVLILVLTALGLNGYSCFRLFGRVFGGVNNDVPAGSLDLLLRERFALAGVVLLLIVVGCIPLISEITIA
jgi:NADH-quinone oxidoreductase subunit M